VGNALGRGGRILSAIATIDGARPPGWYALADQPGDVMSNTGRRTDTVSRPTTWHHQVFTAVGQWQWLRALDESVSAVVVPLYDRHRNALVVELMHGGRWAGHSLHTALSDLPIGLWSGALGLDVVGNELPTPGNRMGAAGTLSVAGLVAASATVATGVTDWAVSDGEDRRVGLAHGMLNLAGMVLQVSSLVARLTGHGGSARVLGAGSMTVTAAAGYVGGHLVQGRAVMVNRVATHTGPTRWVRAIPETDLPVDTLVGGRGRRAQGPAPQRWRGAARAGRRLQPRRGGGCSAAVSSTGAASCARCTRPGSTCVTVRLCAAPRITPSRCSQRGCATGGSSCGAPNPDPDGPDLEEKTWHGKRSPTWTSSRRAT